MDFPGNAAYKCVYIRELCTRLNNNPPKLVSVVVLYILAIYTTAPYLTSERTYYFLLLFMQVCMHIL